jgi:electron transfer flavoprotein beta subunit
MNIIVCVKQVPDTETRIKIAADNVSIDEADISLVMNPFDEFAVEEALQLKEKFGGEVTVLSAGEEKVVPALRNGLAMGADKAVLVKDEKLTGSDPLGIARVLAAAVGKMSYDLLLFGKQGVGEDHCQVPCLVAEMLGLPQITTIVKLEIDGQTAVAHREIEGATEVIECGLPAVLTAQKGLNEPRYASLKGIMMAKKKPIQTLGLADLELSADDLGPDAAAIRVDSISPPPARGEGKTVEGEPEETAKALADFLRREANII